MSKQQTVYIGLGANLGDRQNNLILAIEKLSEYLEITRISSLYETEAMGFESEDKFLNLVLEANTDLEPLELLKKNQKIEKELGRVYYDDGKYHSRVIDLDILIYGDEIIKKNELTIPHPEIKNRNFVLLPLLEIAPEINDPINQKMHYSEYLTEKLKQDIIKLDKLRLKQSKNLQTLISY